MRRPPLFAPYASESICSLQHHSPEKRRHDRLPGLTFISSFPSNGPYSMCPFLSIRLRHITVGLGAKQPPRSLSNIWRYRTNLDKTQQLPIFLGTSRFRCRTPTDRRCHDRNPSTATRASPDRGTSNVAKGPRTIARQICKQGRNFASLLAHSSRRFLEATAQEFSPG